MNRAPRPTQAESQKKYLPSIHLCKGPDSDEAHGQRADGKLVTLDHTCDYIPDGSSGGVNCRVIWRHSCMNWPGRIVLLVAICVSVFLFSRKFGAALRIILAAKRDPDFRLRPIGPRIRKVLWEVGAQGLVIAQRPLPGLAHAFVFWGFCVFALVTLNHFAVGFGHPFLSPSSFWGSLYFFVAGLFAIAVAISIAGLAFRRFVIRPKWLEPLSPESGLIAFLIFALMITYLAKFW